MSFSGEITERTANLGLNVIIAHSNGYLSSHAAQTYHVVILFS